MQNAPLEVQARAFSELKYGLNIPCIHSQSFLKIHVLLVISMDLFFNAFQINSIMLLCPDKVYTLF